MTLVAFCRGRITCAAALLMLSTITLSPGRAWSGGLTGDESSRSFAAALADTTPPTVVVTAPNGGEVWTTGTNQVIRWSAVDAVGVSSVDLGYSLTGGSPWTSIASGIANSGTYTWLTPHAPTTTARVRVVARDAASNAATDSSDAVFEIRDTKAPTMAVTTPNGGEVWDIGTLRVLTWKATDNVGVSTIKLEYSINGGSTWTLIAALLPNAPSNYKWLVPNVVTTTALVRGTAKDAAGNATVDVSNAVFSIRDAKPPTMAVTTPNGGESWLPGASYKLTWKATDNIGVTTVDLERSGNNGATWTPIATGLTTTAVNGLGGYWWTVPNTPSSQCLIRGTARDAAGNATSDVSNAVFTIRDITAPVANLTSPVGSEVWLTSSSHPITWTATDNVAVTSVALDYSINGGATWLPIASGLANTGSYNWTVPATPIPACRVRATVSDAALNNVQKMSADLTIQTPPAQLPLILSFRADSATGTGPYPSPSAGPIWKDLRGSHDGNCNLFPGWTTSGFTGNGTHASPYRLEFGNDLERVTIPAGSIPELDGVQPITAEMWFKTGFNGATDHWDYLLEWLEMGNGNGGMSIAVEDGRLQVYLKPWVDAGPVAPNTWYHIAVAKDPGHVRIYLNGQRVYSGTNPNMGPQETELALGCSVFRIAEDIGGYYDFLRGAIGSFKLWRGALGDAEVHDSFLADSARYLPSTPITPLAKLVTFKADSANGSAHYSVPGASGPWVDLTGTQTNAALQGFDGNATSGWQGNGTAGDPYRLLFDGIDDVIRIPAGAVTQLQTANAFTAEFWFTTGSDVSHTDEQYLIEWVQDFGSPKGLSIAIAHDNFRVYTAAPFWANTFPVLPHTTYHATVVKKPGQLRVYMNGTLMYTDPFPNFGVPHSEIVLGASTWNGTGNFEEYLATGTSISGFALWQGAMSDAQVAALAATSATLESARPTAALPANLEIRLAGFRPNPATREMNVVFALPTAHPATLELLDVTGRRVAAREVGSLGPGNHTVNLGNGRDVPAGMYWLRLTQDQRAVTAKAAVVR